jgi:hypothetical protein
VLNFCSLNSSISFKILEAPLLAIPAKMDTDSG